MTEVTKLHPCISSQQLIAPIIRHQIESGAGTEIDEMDILPTEIMHRQEPAQSPGRFIGLDGRRAKKGGQLRLQSTNRLPKHDGKLFVGPATMAVNGGIVPGQLSGFGIAGEHSAVYAGHEQ